MIGVSIQGKQYALPEKWEELRPDQYVAVMRAYAAPGSREQFDLLVLRALLDISWWRFSGLLWWQSLKRGRLVYAASVLHQYAEELLPAIAYITNNTPFNHQPMPTIAHAQKQWAGPQQRLLNVTGAELEITENLYAAYSITKELKYLRKLLAVLWRPVVNGQRVAFDDDAIAANEQAQQVLDDAYVWGAKLFYEGSMQYWMQLHPQIFGEEGTGKPDPEAWRKLMRSLAGDKRGTVNDVRQMQTGELFFEMKEREREYQQAKAERLRQKHKMKTHA